MLFQKESLVVRALEDKDKHHLVKWLSDPAVLEYYEGRDNPFNLEKVNEDFYNPGDEKGKCMIEYEGQSIGYIQFYQLDKETKDIYGYTDGNIYGIDQFIGETAFWNKGIGTSLITSMVQFLLEKKNADKVVMDPQTWNNRAIRCYEKCGFKKVKLLPEHEWHEGEYRDCWLIEYTK
ncbi:acetyltransferase [Evansella sp. LMS18]|jgi:aminoglycoside 6'-N-acetyltransferase|uniref:GNAT family N-acetyltransferase n=1 Tax=Evansella sp. LMS18 TaxID=2924033 RepID=UPI0020D0989A|nr:GNAT family N-acetyltransferase [Evansella sp. LMS18]UTR10362.1 acetyltransferase [Evansella sp. LMS18]